MHRRNVSTRRRFLRLAGSTAAISVLPAMISVRPAEATPEMMATAIRTVTGGAPGDATHGRALVLERTNTCILCHSGPFPEEKFQGDLAPNLAGSGNRWSVGQLRLRLVDASRFNPGTIMPSYYRLDGLDRVAPNWRGKPILSAEQIEDIVAYLATLRD